LLKDLRHDPGRSVLTIAGLAIMIVSYLLMAGLADSFQAFGQAPGAFTHNVLLFPADSIDPMQGTVSPAAFDAAVDAVRARFGPTSLVRADPIIFRTLRIGEHMMQVLAAAPDAMQSTYDLALIAGRYPAGTTELAASDEAFDLTGWQLGQTVRFHGRDFTLVGRVRYEAGKLTSVWMTYAAGELVFGTGRGFQLAVLQVSGDVDPEVVRSHLETVPGIRPTYAVYLEQEAFARQTYAVRNILAFARILNLLALSVISLGIFTATSLTLAERSREVGLLRVVGFTPGASLGILLGQALLQTLAAFGLGWAATVWVTQGNAGIFSLQGVQVAIRLSPATLLGGLAFTLLFAGFGVGLTVFQQHRRSLVDLLRG
jgi:hypothetical protein